jgi:hypothetical protein
MDFANFKIVVTNVSTWEALWLLKIVYMNQDGGQQNLQVSNQIQSLVKPSLGETKF